MKDDGSGRPQDPVKGLQTGCLVGYLSEHRDQEGDIELRVEKRKSGSVAFCVADVVHARGLQMAPGLHEHLQLDIEQFQVAAGNPPSDFYAEVARAWPHLEGVRIGVQRHALRETLGGYQQAAEGIVDEEGEIMREVPEAEGMLKDPSDAGCRWELATRVAEGETRGRYYIASEKLKRMTE